jgi:hypothetical protein
MIYRNDLKVSKYKPQAKFIPEYCAAIVGRKILARWTKL